MFEEQETAQRAAAILGCELGQLVDLEIPRRSHYIQVVRKTGPTPKKYPRKAGTPGKDPL